MKLRSTLVLAVVLIVALATSGAALAAGHTGTVTVVHGVPGLTVDVFVNGALTLPNFEFGTVTAPLELEAGTYDLAIAPAGQGFGNAVLTGSATVVAGVNATVVAHLTEAGAPTISIFVNDVSPIMEDNARLVVRHTAAAPAVDVALYDDDDAEADDLVGVLSNLANGQEAQVEVEEDDDYAATLAPAGMSTVVFGPAELDLDDEMAYIVYAVGDLAGGSFTLLLQTIELDEIDTGTVTVVHGVPGLTVDVYVNGALALPGFAPGTVTDPLEMPVGTYDIAIVAAGGDPAMPAISGSATVTDDLNASVVAHLDAAGGPTLSVFVNDVSDIMDDTARLVVRHTAAAPAVDVTLYDDDGAQVGVLSALANPNEVQVEVPEDEYSATIAPAGTSTVVFGPAELDLEDEMSTIVYAVGSVADGTFTLLVQTIELDEIE